MDKARKQGLLRKDLLLLVPCSLVVKQQWDGVAHGTQPGALWASTLSVITTDPFAGHLQLHHPS